MCTFLLVKHVNRLKTPEPTGTLTTKSCLQRASTVLIKATKSHLVTGYGKLCAHARISPVCTSGIKGVHHAGCNEQSPHKKGKIMMKPIQLSIILALGLLASAGCSPQSMCQELVSQLYVANRDNEKMAEDLAAARQRNADLERRIADFEKQLAGRNIPVPDLRSHLDQSKGSLAKAEKDLLKALQPEIAKGTVAVRQSGDALTINLASSLLFDSGQDQLKASGTDALKRVGNVLKDFSEKQVHVAGYTDNVAITGSLQKKFPSNKELSDARAESAAQALRDGGVSSNLSAAGHGDSHPIASNDTAVGRATNRRVEVIVK